MLHLPRWCSGCRLLFCSRRNVKDAESETKIRKMGRDCSNRLGSTSPPNEAIIHFPIGLDGPRLIPQPPVWRQRGLPTVLWINRAFGPSQPAPTPPRALMIGRREGSLVTCDLGASVHTGRVNSWGHRTHPRTRGATVLQFGVHRAQVSKHGSLRGQCRGLLDSGPWGPVLRGQYKAKDCDIHNDRLFIHELFMSRQVYGTKYCSGIQQADMTWPGQQG